MISVDTAIKIVTDKTEPLHEVKKVDHYYLSVDAVNQPMKVREDTPNYRS